MYLATLSEKNQKKLTLFRWFVVFKPNQLTINLDFKLV